MHAPAEIFSTVVDTSTLEVNIQLSLEESNPSETHSSEAIAHNVQEEITLAEVFSFPLLFFSKPPQKTFD